MRGRVRPARGAPRGPAPVARFARPPTEETLLKTRLTSALALGAAALAGGASGTATATAVPGHVGGAELLARSAPPAKAAEPPFARPRVAYRKLYRAAARAPAVDPGRNILRHGLRGGGEITTARVRRSNMVLWREPTPDPSRPTPRRSCGASRSARAAATRPRSRPAGPTAGCTSSTSGPGAAWGGAATRPRRAPRSRAAARRSSTRAAAPRPGRSAGRSRPRRP